VRDACICCPINEESQIQVPLIGRIFLKDFQSCFPRNNYKNTPTHTHTPPPSQKKNPKTTKKSCKANAQTGKIKSDEKPN